MLYNFSPVGGANTSSCPRGGEFYCWIFFHMHTSIMKRSIGQAHWMILYNSVLVPCSGGLRTLRCNGKLVTPVTLLRGGHSSIVRCMSFDHTVSAHVKSYYALHCFTMTDLATLIFASIRLMKIITWVIVSWALYLFKLPLYYSLNRIAFLIVSY